MIGEVLLCALLAAALLVLLWLLCAQVLLPIRTKNTFVLLLARGDGAGLEQDCRAYLLLRNVGAIRRPLLLIDDGLTDEGRRLAEQLTELDSRILLCRMEELGGVLRRDI